MSKLGSFPNSRQIEVEACAWIAQLDGGNPSQEDLDAFREWIQRSPRHQVEIKRLSGLWNELNVLTELAVPIKKTSPRPGFLNLTSATIALTVLIGVTLAIFLLPAHTFLPSITEGPYYATTIGERKPITLTDGSKLLLNTDSRIQVDYNPKQRTVHLLRGEAFFEVAHNRDRPFLVYAGANVVRAVGTAFSVHVQKSDVAVIVTEGTVELSSMTNAAKGAGPWVPKVQVTKLTAVQAGQSATVDDKVETLQSIQPAEMRRKLSWREGVLSFSGERLEQVVEEVSRYTPVTIIISDPTIRQVAIGGYFKAGETEAMFEALETSFGVRVNRVNDRLVYLDAK